MTPFGTLVFSAIGVLFAGGVVALIWWAVRGNNAMVDALRRDGWTVTQSQPGAETKWTARRIKDGVTGDIEVTARGVKNKTVWTRIRVNADTGEADVLVERKMPGFLASDGVLADMLGFKPPPRWDGANPTFAADHQAYASGDSAAARWLSEINQYAIVEFNQTAARRVSIRFYRGAIEARWAREPRDAVHIESVVALLHKLRR